MKLISTYDTDLSDFSFLILMYTQFESFWCSKLCESILSELNQILSFRIVTYKCEMWTYLCNLFVADHVIWHMSVTVQISLNKFKLNEFNSHHEAHIADCNLKHWFHQTKIMMNDLHEYYIFYWS